jgi:carbon-monoxide dehydrogenase iron sulfur subunit
MPELYRGSAPCLTVVPERCTGCQICLLACSFEHEGIFRPSAARLKVAITRRLVDGTLPEVFDYPIICKQCDPAPCAEVCSEDAISTDETGVVRVDQDRCIGCGLCVPACPNGVMEIDPDSGRAYKCDLCGGKPQCAALCPCGALLFAFEESIP